MTPSPRTSEVFLGLNRPSSDTVAGLSRPFGYHELRRFRGAAPREAMDFPGMKDSRESNMVFYGLFDGMIYNYIAYILYIYIYMFNVIYIYILNMIYLYI